ncbi:MAG TPA: YIP1 family protein [Defluviitaleaceae bacterium]|nr:YIP1 family protein [Candidatus Epulonipiscium sp.]HOA80655.1 YIP1 family protein [Defluviitaleaceae bacterium]
MEDNLNVEIAEKKSMNIFKKILFIFTSPSELLKDIMDHPKMVMPLLFSSIFLVIAQFIRMPLSHITTQRVNDAYLQYGIPIQQEAVSNSVYIFSSLISPASLILSWLTGGFVLWIFVKIFKGKSSIKQILSLYAHSYIIRYIGFLIVSPINLILNTDVVIFSPAVFLVNPSILSFTYILLSSLEFFTIWSMVIVGFGISMFNNFTKPKGLIISFLYFILTNLLIVGISMIPLYAINLLM